jgi:hypothetical protein
MKGSSDEMNSSEFGAPHSAFEWFHLDICLLKMLDSLFTKIISKVFGHVLSRFDHGPAEILGRARLRFAAAL